MTKTIEQRGGMLPIVWDFLGRVNMLINQVPSKALTVHLSKDASDTIEKFMKHVGKHVSDSRRGKPSDIQNLIGEFKKHIVSDLNVLDQVSLYFETVIGQYDGQQLTETSLISAMNHLEWLLREYKAELQDVSENSVGFTVLGRSVSVSSETAVFLKESLNWSTPNYMTTGDFLSRQKLLVRMQVKNIPLACLLNPASETIDADARL